MTFPVGVFAMFVDLFSSPLSPYLVSVLVRILLPANTTLSLCTTESGGGETRERERMGEVDRREREGGRERERENGGG